MSVSSEFLISREDELALHKRLVDGDVAAPADIANVFIDGLIKWLIDNNSSKIPEDLCVDAAEDAWKALVKNPASFEPSGEHASANIFACPLKETSGTA